MLPANFFVLFCRHLSRTSSIIDFAIKQNGKKNYPAISNCFSNSKATTMLLLSVSKMQKNRSKTVQELKIHKTTKLPNIGTRRREKQLKHTSIDRSLTHAHTLAAGGRAVNWKPQTVANLIKCIKRRRWHALGTRLQRQ